MERFINFLWRYLEVVILLIVFISIISGVIYIARMNEIKYINKEMQKCQFLVERNICEYSGYNNYNYIYTCKYGNYVEIMELDKRCENFVLEVSDD